MMSPFEQYTKLSCELLIKEENGSLDDPEYDEIVHRLEKLWWELSDTDRSLLENMRSE